MKRGLAAVAILLVWLPAESASATPDVDALVRGDRFSGVLADDDIGTSVSNAGDINNDGKEDFVVGGFDADRLGRNGSGVAYVIYGAANPSPAEVGNLGAAGFEIAGAEAGDQLGVSVAAAGDVNGDEIDDVIVAAYGASPIGQFSGSAHVIYGENTPDLANVDLASLGARGFVIQSNQVGRLDSVSGAGRFNGDATDDIVVEQSAGGFGSTYVIYGQDLNGGDVPDTRTDRLSATSGGSAGEMARGMVIAATSTTSIGAVTSGDFAGDSRTDIASGAFNATPAGRSNTGQVFVVYGENVADPADVSVTALGTRGYTITGVNSDLLGREVSSAGDFNDDEREDLIAASHSATSGAASSGVAYIVYGSAGTGDVPDLDLAAGGTTGAWMKTIGPSQSDLVGVDVSSVEDANADGINDVIVGAGAVDGSAGADDGAAFVLLGQNTADPADVDLAQINGGSADARGFRILRNQALDLGNFGPPSAAAPNLRRQRGRQQWRRRRRTDRRRSRLRPR